MEFCPDPATFFTTEQNVAFEHTIANVLEADGCFPDLTSKIRGNLVDQLGSRKSLYYLPGKFAGPLQVPKQNGKNLMRGDKCAVAIDSTDAVGITIECKARVILAP